MSKSHICKTFLCLAACLIIAATAPALAENDDNNRLDEAWEDAVGDQEPVLTDKQFALLNNLAFQAAVTKVCDGYELDTAKFAAGIAEATSPAPEGLSDEDEETWKTAVLLRFGTTYGLFLAEGNDEEADFCASARELKADSETPNVWQ